MTERSEDHLRSQIAEVLHAYCAAVDARDAGRVASYFAEDAELVLVGGSASGHRAIEGAFADAFGPPGITTQHMVVSPVIRVDQHGTTATATSGLIIFRRSAEGVVAIGAGQYHDELRHSAGGWKFTAKVVDLRIPLTPIGPTAPNHEGDER